jgi:hypothetical protein
VTHPLYHLDMKIESCRIVVKLNDVTVIDMIADGPTPEWFAPPLNPYLIGEGNVLEVELWPAKPDGRPDDLAKAEVEGVVRRYMKREPVVQGSGAVSLSLGVVPELAERMRAAREEGTELEVPQNFFFVFDNEGASFAGELSDAGPFTDEDALRDYAMHLRDLMIARDANALAHEMAPKVEAYAAAFDDDVLRIAQGLAQVLHDDYAPRGFVTDFERDEVELISCAGGRMWELRRPGGRPLVQTPPDADEGTMQIPIIAGYRDGALRVVR